MGNEVSRDRGDGLEEDGHDCNKDICKRCAYPDPDRYHLEARPTSRVSGSGWSKYESLRLQAKLDAAEAEIVIEIVMN